MPSQLQGRLFDCDRALTTKGGTLRAWPGGRRFGRKLRDEDAMGPGTRKDQFAYARPYFQIVRFPQHYLAKSNGHGLAVVDTQGSADGRVVALAHHSGGLTGEQLIGVSWFDGTGPDDLELRGVFTGSTPKIYLVQITHHGASGADPDQFKVSTDGGRSYSAAALVAGDWISLGNGIEARWRRGNTGHTLNDVWTFAAGERPSLAGWLNRIGPHTYPAITGGLGKTFISTAYDLVKIDDGVSVRDAGLPQPQIHPTIQSDIPTSATLTDLGGTNTTPVAWAAASGATGLLVRNRDTDPGVAVQAESRYLELKIPISLRRGNLDLAYHDLSGPATIKASVKRIRFFLYAKLKSGRIEKNHLSLVLADTAALAGNRKVIKIPSKVRSGQWTRIDLPYTATEDFVCASVGIRLEGSLDSQQFFSSNFIRLFVEAIETDGNTGTGEGVVETSSLFSTGDWYFRFCWRRTSDGRVGPPSPWSEPIKVNGSAVKIDLSGSYPGIVSGLANVPPIGVDSAVIFVATSQAGGDPRLGGDGLSFFRLTAEEGIPVSSIPAVNAVGGGGNTGTGTVENLTVVPGSPVETWTLTCLDDSIPGSEVFRVFGSISGLQTDAIVGVRHDNAEIGFQLQEGSVNFVAGDTFSFGTNTGASTTSLIYTLSDEAQRGLLLTKDNPRDPFYNSEPRPGEIAIADGNLIVTARRPAYGVGKWTWTDGSNIIVPVNSGSALTSPIVGRWMEGRTIRKAGEATNYRILKAMDRSGDGVLDALYIGSKFDPKQQVLEGPYSGSTGNFQGIIISDNRAMDWCNVTSLEGEDIEAQSLLNRLEVMPPGDEIVAIFKTDQSLWVVGGDNAALLVQNPSALADLPFASGTAYSNPVHYPGVGAVGPRVCLARPDGTTWVLGPKGQLWVFSSNGVTKHPLSERLSAFLSGRGFLVDTDALKFAYMTALKPDGDADYVWLGLSGAGQATGTPTVGVRIRARDDYPLTQPIDGSFDHPLLYEIPWKDDTFVRT